MPAVPISINSPFLNMINEFKIYYVENFPNLMFVHTWLYWVHMMCRSYAVQGHHIRFGCAGLSLASIMFSRKHWSLQVWWFDYHIKPPHIKKFLSLVLVWVFLEFRLGLWTYFKSTEHRASGRIAFWCSVGIVEMKCQKSSWVSFNCTW